MNNMDKVVELLKKERDQLTKQIAGISAALSAFGVAYKNGKGRPVISAAGRARIAAAQRERWMKLKAEGKGNVARIPKKRTMSAAARKRIASAQRARWAKIKAGEKKNAA